MQDQAFHTLALSLVPGLGRTRALQLLQHYGTAQRILGLSPQELTKWRVPFDSQAFIREGCALQAAQEVRLQAHSLAIRILALCDEHYPERLKQIYEPPLVLYCRGDASLLSRPSVSIVGARRCTVYGKEMTEKLAGELAQAGLVIVSGMARGIDARAHEGCLKAGGSTIAVLGNGVDQAYPRENRKLYRRITEQGCAVSEFPCGTYPAPQNFPIRNRVISGLSVGTLVTEAGRFSGSLITARMALEQNRELWALPGNVTSLVSVGTNLLIKQGAKPITTSQDVLEELPPYLLDQLVPKQGLEREPVAQDTLSQEQATLLKLLPPGASVQFDSLLEETGWTNSRLNQALLDMEIKGLLAQTAGRRYHRKLFDSSQGCTID